MPCLAKKSSKSAIFRTAIVFVPHTNA